MAMVSSTPAGRGLPMGLMPGALPSDQASRHTLKMTAMRLLPGQSQSCCFIAQRRSLPTNTLRFFHPDSSWPDLFRPSTTFLHRVKDVDGRDKHGPDAERTSNRPKIAPALSRAKAAEYTYPERKGEIMRKSATKVNAMRRTISRAGGHRLAAMLLGAMLPCAMPGGAVAQDSNAIVMELDTATLKHA